LKLGLHGEVVVDDPEGLAECDHRRQFWDGYARFDSRYLDVEPEVLKEAGLNDLTVEPLLLYLLMYSGLAGKDWPEAKENRMPKFMSGTDGRSPGLPSRNGRISLR